MWLILFHNEYQDFVILVHRKSKVTLLSCSDAISHGTGEFDRAIKNGNAQYQMLILHLELSDAVVDNHLHSFSQYCWSELTLIMCRKIAQMKPDAAGISVKQGLCTLLKS